jgi:hypothetical protein
LREECDLLRDKQKGVDEEIRDIRKEYQGEKEDFIDNLRDQEAEIDFLKMVMKSMLRDGELQKIRMRAQYDDMDKKWTLPPFYLKGKEIELPKIKNAAALVDEEMNKRDLEFGERDMAPSPSPSPSRISKYRNPDNDASAIRKGALNGSQEMDVRIGKP